MRTSLASAGLCLVLVASGCDDPGGQAVTSAQPETATLSGGAPASAASPAAGVATPAAEDWKTPPEYKPAAIRNLTDTPQGLYQSYRAAFLESESILRGVHDGASATQAIPKFNACRYRMLDLLRRACDLPRQQRDAQGLPQLKMLELGLNEAADIGSDILASGEQFRRVFALKLGEEGQQMMLSYELLIAVRNEGFYSAVLVDDPQEFWTKLRKNHQGTVARYQPQVPPPTPEELEKQYATMTFDNAPEPPEAGYYIFVEGFPLTRRLDVLSLTQNHTIFSHKGKDCLIFEGREFLTKREKAMQIFASPSLEVSPRSPNIMRVKWDEALHRQLSR